MQIEIKAKWRPYFHKPGMMCLIPGSVLAVKFFPTCLEIVRLDSQFPEVVAQWFFYLSGPIREFTVCQDLEIGKISVSGQSEAGYFQYTLYSLTIGNGFALKLDRFFTEELSYEVEFKVSQYQIINKQLEKVERGILSKKETLFFLPLDETNVMLYQFPSSQKVFFGEHKALDWEMVLRRHQFKEIVPIWLRQAFALPKEKIEGPLLPFLSEGNLLRICQECIQKKDRAKLELAFLNLFDVCFKDLFIPQLQDLRCFGFSTSDTCDSSNQVSLQVLQKSAELLLSLFFQVREKEIFILPLLPISLSCGKAIALSCGNLGAIDFEWSKKSLRQLIFHSHFDGELVFHFPSSIKEFRLRQHHKDRGTIVTTGQALRFKEGKQYYFDRFRG